MHKASIVLADVSRQHAEKFNARVIAVMTKAMLPPSRKTPETPAELHEEAELKEIINLTSKMLASRKLLPKCASAVRQLERAQQQSDGAAEKWPDQYGRWFKIPVGWFEAQWSDMVVEFDAMCARNFKSASVDFLGKFRLFALGLAGNSPVPVACHAKAFMRLYIEERLALFGNRGLVWLRAAVQHARDTGEYLSLDSDTCFSFPEQNLDGFVTKVLWNFDGGHEVYVDVNEFPMPANTHIHNNHDDIGAYVELADGPRYLHLLFSVALNEKYNALTTPDAVKNFAATVTAKHQPNTSSEAENIVEVVETPPPAKKARRPLVPPSGGARVSRVVTLGASSSS
eukprot:TRINITY_DN25200_c0_g1_i1.p1 TRINITY_DN25200_c0_g1~~TRINITY_DN25200_c0_g1_i1.p1  ORF type:complete len:342 (+),score=65.65 TRINITY_DN25200_c0_g1_i1:67-1092(+)